MGVVCKISSFPSVGLIMLTSCSSSGGHIRSHTHAICFGYVSVFVFFGGPKPKFMSNTSACLRTFTDILHYSADMNRNLG